MDTVVQIIKGVTCYIADIIVTGAADVEDLGHLEDVLQHLQKQGINAK